MSRSGRPAAVAAPQHPTIVDTCPCPNRMSVECRPARRHISFLAHRPAEEPAVTSHLLPVFARVDLAFERGEGAWLMATNGERYLDFISGIAVNALGHAHPHMIAALAAQAEKLWHVSNLFRIPEGERL